MYQQVLSEMYAEFVPWVTDDIFGSGTIQHALRLPLNRNEALLTRGLISQSTL